jgi:hypothetical protein
LVDQVTVAEVDEVVEAMLEMTGGVRSIVTERADEAKETFPAASVSLNVIEFEPEASVPAIATNSPPEQTAKPPEAVPSSKSRT